MELPKISDSQKKILKSSLIALVIVVILLGLGVVFSKQKNQILQGVIESRNKTSKSGEAVVMGPDGKPLTNSDTTTKQDDSTTTTNETSSVNSTKTNSATTKNTPTQSKGVVAFLRNFFSGNTLTYVSGEKDKAAPVLDAIQKDLNEYREQQGKGSSLPVGEGINKYGLASDDPRFIKQLQDAHEQYSKLEEQLHTATAQLQATQNQLTAYQAGASGNQSGTLFQSTAGTVQNQLTQYQAQVLDLQVQTTFAAIQMAYYFCQGITPGANQGAIQEITLDQIANGSVQLMSDDGTFNYQVCGSLLSWVNTLPTWLQAQGPSLQVINYIPYLQQILQSATFFYCPTLGQPQATSTAQVTLGSVYNQLTNYTPPNCPASQNTSGQFTNTGGISTAINSADTYNDVSLSITSITPNPVLSAAPVTISWYSTGVDPDSCAIIDITNDPTNFSTGTIIASQKPAIGSLQFTPMQAIGEHTIGVQCSVTQNNTTNQVRDKAKFNLVQATTTPFVALSISDTAIISGDPSPKLSWVSGDIIDNKCSLYKNGVKVAENLSKQAVNYQLPLDTTLGTLFYQLACQSSQNTLVPSNPVMYVVSQPGAIAVDLKANGQNSLTFSGNQQNVILTWTQTGTINSCTGNFANGQLPASYSGTNYTQEVSTSKYFTISCTGPGNQKATDMVLIQKIPPTPPLPITVDLKINNQDGIMQTASTPINAIFTWSSTGPVASCSSNFVPNNMSPVLPASYSGQNYSQQIKEAAYFVISCTGVAGQQATDTVLVSMGGKYANATISFDNLVGYLADTLVIEDSAKNPTAVNVVAKKLGIQPKTYLTGIDEKTNTAVVAGSIKRNNATTAQIQLQLLDKNKQLVYTSNIFNYSGSTITNNKDDLLPFVFANVPALVQDNSIIIKDLVSTQVLIGPIAIKNLKDASYQNMQVLVSEGFAVKDSVKFPTLLNILAQLLGIQIGNYTTGLDPISKTATVAGLLKLNNSSKAQLQLQLVDANKNVSYSSNSKNYTAITRLNNFNQPLPKDTPYPFVFTNIPVQSQFINNNIVITDTRSFIIKDTITGKVLYGPQSLRSLGMKRIFVNNFNLTAPPWQGIFDIVTTNLKKVLVGMIVYTQLYVIPIIKNFPPDVWQPRSDLNVTVDPQKSYIEEGEMYITGRIAAQKYEVKNLTMEVRYGTIPGVTSKLDAQNLAGNITRGMFKKAALQKQTVEFYKTDPANGNVITSSSITIPPKTSVTFGARITGLDKDKPYFFDIVDSTTLVPILKTLNQ